MCPEKQRRRVEEFIPHGGAPLMFHHLVRLIWRAIIWPAPPSSSLPSSGLPSFLDRLPAEQRQDVLLLSVGNGQHAGTRLNQDLGSREFGCFMREIRIANN